MDDDMIVGFMLGVFSTIFILCLCVTNLDIYEQAIEKGFAEYNQSTGDWQWKEAKR
jgi:hypothetical protein